MPGGSNAFHPHSSYLWGVTSSPWMHYHHTYNTHWHGYGCRCARGWLLFFVLGTGAATLFFNGSIMEMNGPEVSTKNINNGKEHGVIGYPDNSHPTDVGTDHCEWVCVCRHRNLYCWHLNRTKYEISWFGILIKHLCCNLQMVLQLSTPADMPCSNELPNYMKKVITMGLGLHVCSTTLLDAVQWQCNTVWMNRGQFKTIPAPL